MSHKSQSTSKHHLDHPLPVGYPQRIYATISGNRRTLGWHQRSGGYRLRYRGEDGKEKTKVFGPDPEDARRDAERDGPLLVAGQKPEPKPKSKAKKRRKPGDCPAEIVVTCFNHKYVAKLRSNKQYRAWAKGGFVHCGSDPDKVPRRLEDELLKRFFPDQAAQQEEVTLQRVLHEWLAVKEGEISIACFKSYQSKHRAICRCAGGLASIPIEEWGAEEWKRLKKKLAVIHPKGYTDDSYIIRSVLERASKQHGIRVLNGQEVFRKRRRKGESGEEEEARKHHTLHELHTILAAADTQWKALILLSANGGFEPGEISRLRWQQFHKEEEWLENRRHKTGVRRRCWLWPETREALAEWGVKTSGYVFTNGGGRPWFNGKPGEERHSLINPYRALCEPLGAYVPGYGLYALRHFFGHYGMMMRANFQFSQDMVMGHKKADISRTYQGRQDDGFIWGRCEFVRRMLQEGEQAAFDFQREWLGRPEARQFSDWTMGEEPNVAS